MINMDIRYIRKKSDLFFQKNNYRSSFLWQSVTQLIGKPIDFKIKEHMLTHYKKFIKPGDLVFDIGANIGKFTKLFLKLNAKIICVEPQRDLADDLVEKFKKNDSVFVINNGIGSYKTKSMFYICEDNTKSSFIKDWNKKSHENIFKIKSSYEIDIITLDDLIERFGTPTFCKIDVEGFELEVLKGLNKPIKYLSFEFHKFNIDYTKKCIKELKKLGKPVFKYYYSNNFNLLSKNWMSSKELIRSLKTKNNYSYGDIFVKIS
jgi:FkbM family methyltransferase